MILDRLAEADRYFSLHLDFAPAITFLRDQPLDRLPEGRIAIAGENLYAMVSRPTTHPREEAKLEAHRQYIDIHYLISGVEQIGWKSRTQCQERDGQYDAAKDFELFADKPDAYVDVHPGAFAIFFPDDAHAPLIGTGQLHKVVVKVAL